MSGIIISTVSLENYQNRIMRAKKPHFVYPERPIVHQPLHYTFHIKVTLNITEKGNVWIMFIW